MAPGWDKMWRLSIHSVLLSVFHGCDALGAMENLGKVTEGRKTQKLGNLGHGQVGFGKQVFAFLQPAGDHVIDRGDAIFPLEGMGEIVFVHVCFFCQLIQRQGFFEMVVDIPADSGALVIAHGVLRFSGHRKSGASHQADDQNFHERLANILITWLLQLHFTENIAQAGGNIHTFKMVQNAELAVGIFGNGKFHTLNAQNNVLQRLGIQADFRVGDIGIDDDQVVGVDRVDLIFDEELTLATNNVKQFRMIVGVGNGMPIAAIFGTGGI